MDRIHVMSIVLIDLPIGFNGCENLDEDHDDPPAFPKAKAFYCVKQLQAKTFFPFFVIPLTGAVQVFTIIEIIYGHSGIINFLHRCNTYRGQILSDRG